MERLLSVSEALTVGRRDEAAPSPLRHLLPSLYRMGTPSIAEPATLPLQTRTTFSLYNQTMYILQNIREQGGMQKKTMYEKCMQRGGMKHKKAGENKVGWEGGEQRSSNKSERALDLEQSPEGSLVGAPG